MGQFSSQVQGPVKKAQDCPESAGPPAPSGSAGPSPASRSRSFAPRPPPPPGALELPEAGGQGCLQSKGKGQLLRKGSSCSQFKLDGKAIKIDGVCLDYF